MVTKKRRKAQFVSDETSLAMNIRRTAVSLAVAAALPSAMITSAYAQEAEEAADEEQAMEEIITTGIRGSLRNSALMKQGSDSIVEAISAEDIGKLPDASIAESLARLPGLTVQRLNGRGQQLSIRGLGPDFTTALLNGREQVTTGDNRGVEFDQYPSELLSQVVVYKTPDASLIGAGLAGTADMRTIRPLEHGRRTISGQVRYEWAEKGDVNPDVSDDGQRASFTYIDQFADGDWGLALGVSHMANPGGEERFEIWDFNPMVDDNRVMAGTKNYVRSSELERNGVIGVLEYGGSDTFSTSLDVYYSEFEETQSIRGVEIPLFWGGGTLDPNYTAEDGLIVSGEYNDIATIVRNNREFREADLFAAGWNLELYLSDDWVATLDLSTSQVDRKDEILESTAGVAYARSGFLDTVGFEMDNQGATYSSNLDFDDPTAFVVTDPMGWGGDRVQAGYLNTPDIEDELDQVSLAFERELGGAISSVEFGANFATREKTKRVEEWVLTLGESSPGVNIEEAPLPSLIGSVDVSFNGLGEVLAYDPRDLMSVYVPSPQIGAFMLPKNWSVEEDVTLAYVQFNLDAQLGDFPLSGNFGLQYMEVDQSSDGLAESDTGERFTVSGGTTWDELLPSLNLALDFNNDTYLRFSYARTVARARMDDMRATGTFSFDEARIDGTTPQDGPWSASTGNPELKPWLADAYDLSLEKYFAGGTAYVALAYFYKDLDTFIFDGPNTIIDFSGFPVPPGLGTPGTNLGLLSGPSNGDGGRINGWEFSLSLTGDMLADSLQNFGLVGNFSNTDSSIKPDPDASSISVPGLSEEVVNVTLYYENETFSARVSNRYRSDFLGEVTGFGGGRGGKDVLSESIIDAQVSYDFIDGPLAGMSIFAQGINLTDEPLRTIMNDDSRQINDYQRYGRTYMIGVSYNYE